MLTKPTAGLQTSKERRKMDSKERVENLTAMIDNLKESEDKIRMVRQDLEAEARQIAALSTLRLVE